MVFLASAPVFADKIKADVANGEKIFKNGKSVVAHPDTPKSSESVPAQVAEAQAGIEVPACTTCHGDNGMGSDAMGTPRLVGLGFKYLVKQLNDFAAERRKDTTMYVMNNNAKGLTEQERIDVAAYLTMRYFQDDPELKPSTKTDVEGLGGKFGKSHLGKTLVLEGASDRGISACKSCHGWNGRGRAPMYPAIGKQRYVYLVNQLTKWRDGAANPTDKEKGRSNDFMGQMRAVAKHLTDEDIQNAAAYLTAAKRSTLGNPRIPDNRQVFANVELTGSKAAAGH